MSDDLNSAAYWDAAYDEERDGWDMGTPTPVFVDMLTRFSMDFSKYGDRDYAALGRPPRVLIPCSGRGYDALYFATRGWDVTAVDFAEHPLRWLRGEAEHAGVEIEILQEDMFTLGKTHPGHFDLIVEYTCVCAIDPARREEFVRFCREVLRPDGTVMALLFPVDGRPGGPPFSIDVEDFKSQMAPHFTLLHESMPETSVRPRLGHERLILWRKQ